MTTAAETAALTPLQLHHGVWSGVLSGWPAGPAPELVLLHGGEEVAGVDVTPADGGDWRVEVRVPDAVISDGAHALTIAETGGGAPLASFTLIAGDALRDNIRAEVALLRAELDMLKRAFRHHARQG